MRATLSNNYIVSRYICQEYFGESRSETGSHPATGANHPQPHVSRAILRIQYTRQREVFSCLRLAPGTRRSRRFTASLDGTEELPAALRWRSAGILYAITAGEADEFRLRERERHHARSFQVQCLPNWAIVPGSFVSLSAWSEPRPVQVKAPCSQCWVDCGWEAARRASSTAPDGIS